MRELREHPSKPMGDVTSGQILPRWGQPEAMESEWSGRFLASGSRQPVELGLGDEKSQKYAL